MKPTLAAALVALGFAAGCAAAPALLGHAGAQSPVVAAALDEASRVYPVPYRVLWCVANKETGGKFNVDALNRAGPYFGLFQWDAPTWAYAKRTLRNPAAPEWPLVAWDASPYEPRPAALAAAGLIARGEGWRWPTLRGCW